MSYGSFCKPIQKTNKQKATCILKVFFSYRGKKEGRRSEKCELVLLCYMSKDRLLLYEGMSPGLLTWVFPLLGFSIAAARFGIVTALPILQHFQLYKVLMTITRPPLHGVLHQYYREFLLDINSSMFFFNARLINQLGVQGMSVYSANFIFSDFAKLQLFHFISGTMFISSRYISIYFSGHISLNY